MKTYYLNWPLTEAQIDELVSWAVTRYGDVGEYFGFGIGMERILAIMGVPRGEIKDLKYTLDEKVQEKFKENYEKSKN